jgi:hypothetical protein
VAQQQVLARQQARLAAQKAVRQSFRQNFGAMSPRRQLLWAAAAAQRSPLLPLPGPFDRRAPRTESAAPSRHFEIFSNLRFGSDVF